MQCGALDSFSFVQTPKVRSVGGDIPLGRLAQSPINFAKVPSMKDRRLPFKIFPECTVKHETYHTSIQSSVKTLNQTKLFNNILSEQLAPEHFPPSSSNCWGDNSLKSNFHSLGHICPFCGKVYSRKYGLKIHVRTHTGYKPLKCKFCLRPFSDPSNLNKHVRLHSDSDTPYRCPICGKVLVRRRDLQRHMKSRHDQTDSLKDSERKG